MSNTTQQPDPVPTEQPSSPAEQPTTPADPPASSAPDNSPSSPAQPTSNSPPPAETNDTPTQPPPATSDQTPPEQTSQPPPNSPSPPATSSQAPPPNTTPSNTPPPAETTANNEPTTADNDATEVLTTVVTVTPSDGTTPQTSIVLVTSTTTNAGGNSPATTVSSSSTPTATPIDTSGGGGGGLSQQSKVAIGVVVPIAAIAILALVGLFWWKKRRARQQAEEERRKEVEDYSYNPNADPTIPNVGMGGDGAYEMREDGSSGYRGWGTTVAGSTGRKASTTMSGGVNGQAYSDATSPTFRGNMSDAPLMDGSYSPEGEILGAMGPPASSNRGGDIHRGPSNASSSYSAAARSEGSDGAGMTYGAGGTYYDQYAQNNPYSDNAFNQGPPSQPIIRDNPARRNTRIESPSHYPQQSAGISQNF